ncbi:MAG: hypothetical protein R3B95_13215 [Nitrospirales bacterium]|nr:hypothetical protein [Nitrospirales bacterium]
MFDMSAMFNPASTRLVILSPFDSAQGRPSEGPGRAYDLSECSCLHQLVILNRRAKDLA